MRIGGWCPLSLSDYPGHVAAVVFTAGCNYRCPFCHNRRLWRPEAVVDEAQVWAELQRRRPMLEAVVVSGGEPTLQDDLADWLARIRSLGLRTKLDTNGSRPAEVTRLLKEGLLDFVAVDVKAPWHRYRQLAGTAVDVTAVRTTVERVWAAGVAHQFRTTWVRSWLDADDLAAIAAQLPAGAEHVVQPFIPALAADPCLRAAV